jgi:hypothetical protein
MIVAPKMSRGMKAFNQKLIEYVQTVTKAAEFLRRSNKPARR